MSALELVQISLLSPMVLAFVLGAGASFLKSDLRVPDAVSSALSIYLLLAIGLKGGAELAKASFADFWAPALSAVALGIAIPLVCFQVLLRLGRFSVADAAALAAHYGSVSAVTFTASLVFLERLQVPSEPFMPALMAILEIPAIVVALLLARRSLATGSWGHAMHEVFTGKSVILLGGGLVIGFLAGPPGLDRIAPFFVLPFAGVLTIFLLDLGRLAAERAADLRAAGPFLLGFGVAAPLVNGTLGVVLGTVSGLSMGGAMLVGVLAASASYIAAPAAVRAALPQANPGYYLTASLAITFPFNLTVGIPFLYALARMLHG